MSGIPNYDAFNPAAATYYDFLNDPDEAQGHINFMLRFALPAKSILDAGAGTGRIGIPFAEHRLNVTCLEPSRAMTNALLVKVAQKPQIFPFITVVCGDPAEVQLKQQFDLVSLYWAFIYICSEEQRLKTLVNLRRHLAPGGRLIVDGSVGLKAFRPEAGRFEMDRVKVGRREYVQYFEAVHKEGPDYSLTVTFDTLEEGQLVETFNTVAGVRVVPSAQYMRDILNEAGLVVEEEWGIGEECYLPLAEAEKPEKYILAVTRAK